jgi:hypothetical protein
VKGLVQLARVAHAQDLRVCVVCAGRGGGRREGRRGGGAGGVHEDLNVLVDALNCHGVVAAVND